MPLNDEGFGPALEELEVDEPEPPLEADELPDVEETVTPNGVVEAAEIEDLYIDQ